MQDPYHYRMWLFALAIVVLQFLLSDEGRRIMSSGVWQTSLTVSAIFCLGLAWPYVKANTLRVWHGEAYFWPVAILVVSALAIVVMTWLATYSHMASLSGEQSDNAGALGLQQKLEADLVTAKQQAEIERKATQGVVARATVLNETIEALTVERDNLQAKVDEQAAELTTKAADALRLKEAKEQLLKKVDSAPTHSEFTLENGQAWISSANTLVNNTIATSKRFDFSTQFHDRSLQQFQESVESLRALAMTITVGDLRN